jgi:hypothetical protein
MGSSRRGGTACVHGSGGGGGGGRRGGGFNNIKRRVLETLDGRTKSRVHGASFTNDALEYIDADLPIQRKG